MAGLDGLTTAAQMLKLFGGKLLELTASGGTESDLDDTEFHIGPLSTITLSESSSSQSVVNLSGLAGLNTGGRGFGSSDLNNYIDKNSPMSLSNEHPLTV